MSTFIPPTPAANKSAEQHEEPSEQVLLEGIVATRQTNGQMVCS